jgi:hypothetical protein
MLGGTNDGDFDTGRLDTLSIPWVAADSETEDPLWLHKWRNANKFEPRSPVLELFVTCH